MSRMTVNPAASIWMPFEAAWIARSGVLSVMTVT
jgi:hypothetical protein